MKRRQTCDWSLSHLTNFWEDWSWSRRPTVHVHWTETKLSCLNKKNCLVKLKNCSCVLMSSAWITTWSWGSLCQSFCLFYSFFPVSDLSKLALSTTLHPKCLSLVKKLQCVPIVQIKVTMCWFLCSIKIRSQLKHAK
jgi:hypothetical protein